MAFHDKQVDHLILLVGGNPLPNAVAGRRLSKPQGQVILMHSNGPGGTLLAAQRLETWLTKQGRHVKRVALDAYDPVSIHDTCVAQLKEIPRTASIGLHYTGGTKAMAVHAHRAIENYANGRVCVFSYLNAHSQQFVFDPPDDSVTHCEVLPTGPQDMISLDELFFLHNWGLQAFLDEPIFLEGATELLSVYVDECGTDWVDWKCNMLYPCCKSNGEWRDEDELAGIPLVSVDTRRWPILERFFDVLWKALGLPDEVGSTTLGEAGAKFSLSALEFCLWLDGKWLESIVLKALLDIAEQWGLHDIRMNIQPYIEGTGSTHFEADVVAMRGYQLFTFSCSTIFSRKLRGELKRKLFEGYIRAHQLGGDEACLGLVAPITGAGDLQAELRSGIVNENRVYVFGRRYWNNLSHAFEVWIEKQSGGRA